MRAVPAQTMTSRHAVGPQHGNLPKRSRLLAIAPTAGRKAPLLKESEETTDMQRGRAGLCSDIAHGPTLFGMRHIGGGAQQVRACVGRAE